MSKLTAEEKKRQRLEARIGYVSNVLGLTAGTAALGAALKDERLAQGGKTARAMHKVGRKIPRGPFARLGAKSPKMAGAMAAGAVGLQAANTAGDVVANRVLGRSVEKSMYKEFGMRNEQGISKAYVSPVTRTSGQGFNLEKAWRKQPDERASLLTPGYGFLPGTIQSRKSTRSERAAGTAAGAITGGLAGGFAGARKSPKLAALLASLGAVGGGALGYGGSRYQREFELDAAKKKLGVRPRLGVNLSEKEILHELNENKRLRRELGLERMRQGRVNKAYDRENKAQQAALGGAIGAAGGGYLAAKVVNDEAKRFQQLTGQKLPGGRKALARAVGRGKIAGVVGGGAALGSGLGFASAAEQKKRRLKIENDYKKRNGIGVPQSMKNAIGAEMIRRQLEQGGHGKNVQMPGRQINKAYRRYDPEADRQRRIGLYAGLGGGSALVLGAAGARKLKGTKLSMPKGGKKGLALLAGGAAAGGLGAAAYKRGIEIRNQPWT